MKRYLMLVSVVFLFAVSGITLASAMPVSATQIFADEFSGTNIDQSKWIVISGSPSLSNGKLILSGGLVARAELQSLKKFRYSTLRMVITSSNWKPQNAVTDSSFGYEIWQGTNGACHYSVILKANGHLGVMKAQPDATGRCFGDPKFQAHIPITNWEAIRAGKTVRITLKWASNGVTLSVSSGTTYSGSAVYVGVAETANQLKIRLNADTGETYKVDYVRVETIP